MLFWIVVAFGGALVGGRAPFALVAAMAWAETEAARAVGGGDGGEGGGGGD